MVKPKILSDLPPVETPVAAPNPGGEESLRQTILNAMMKKNPHLANMAEPGAMGAEGAPGMPPDQGAIQADELLDPNAPGASGAAPLPPPGQSPAEMIASAVPLPQGAQEPPGAPPGAEARFAAGTGAMDRQIARNLANNRGHAARAGVTPEQLLGAMPGAYSGAQPPPAPGSRQAMIDALLKGVGVQ